MSEEYFDVVNERDEVVGRRTRDEVHRLGLRHRAVHVLIFDSSGRLFLQKRSLSKDTFPGKWDSSVSGHLDSEETYDDCAVRECREELGLELNEPPERLFKIEARPETGWEFVWVYRCENNGPFQPDPFEIETGEWFTAEQLDQWMERSPRDFATGLLLIWKIFTAHYRV